MKLHLCLGVLCISLWLPQLQGAPTSCCTSKTVGGVEYILKREEDTSSYNCLSNCVFEKKDEPGTLFCFASGDLEVVCDDPPSDGEVESAYFEYLTNLTTEVDAVCCKDGIKSYVTCGNGTSCLTVCGNQSTPFFSGDCEECRAGWNHFCAHPDITCPFCIAHNILPACPNCANRPTAVVSPSTDTTGVVSEAPPTISPDTTEGEVVGILVAGGNGATDTSTEFYQPGTGKSCILVKSSLPTPGREFHTLDTVSVSGESVGVLCGGGFTDATLRSCLKFSPVAGTWSPYAPQLQQKRFGSSSWVEPDGNLLLMGGGFDAVLSTEIVDGGLSFSLVQDTLNACSIQLTDYVIITGGINRVTLEPFTTNDVFKYNSEGHVHVDDLLPGTKKLVMGRYSHGCGSYLDGNKNTIFVVAGGVGSGKAILSSTEFTDASSAKWTIGKNSLPIAGALYGMASVSSYNNMIMLFGGMNNPPEEQTPDEQTDILSYIIDEDGTNTERIWSTKVEKRQVQLLTARSYGAATKIMLDPSMCG